MCEKDGAYNPVHNEVNDAIVSHQKSAFLVQSRIFQEEGETKMIDNSSMASPAQVTLNTTISTAYPAQVTNITRNSMNTDTKNNYKY